MKLFKNFKKQIVKIILPPKIIICFSSHGCQGTILEFKWIGYVTKEHISEGGTDFYEVQPIIKGSSENRNHKDKPLSIEKAWQIQNLGFNIYIHYL